MLIFMLTVIVFSEYCTCSLELVHVFFRHGKRTPEKYEICIDDTNAAHWEKTGYGKLTPIGIEDSLKLGAILRNRYQGFLPDSFSPEVIQTLSTNRERTKLTAVAVLSGLFPLSLSDQLTDLLNRSDLYDYTEQKQDFKLRNPKFYCSAFKNELKRISESEEHVILLSNYRDTFHVLQDHCGIHYNTSVAALYVFQSLASAKYYNLTLPSWAEDVYDSLLEIAGLRLATENQNAELRRLTGGRMFKFVLDNMMKKSLNLLLPPQRKMFLYSAHDVNVATTLAVLDLFKPHFPHYNSAVMIELHRGADLKYFVKVYYLKDVYHEPEELYVEHCGKVCELVKLEKMVQPYIPMNYTKECESNVLLD